MGLNSTIFNYLGAVNLAQLVAGHQERGEAVMLDKRPARRAKAGAPVAA